MNISMPITDGSLVRLAQEGNSNAYTLLLERYQQKIRQTVYFYIKDHAYVNDLVQDILLKIFRYLGEFKEECEFSTWTYRIIQNTIKNHYRTMSLRSDSELRFADEQSTLFSASPEYHLMNIELGELVETAIAELSEDLRICFGMHIFEGHTYESIAQRMQCPVGTVRSRIFRARKLVLSVVGHKSHCVVPPI